jgi:signal transduction histidine kinase
LPIDITGTDARFTEAVEAFLRDATGMQFIALRERTLRVSPNSKLSEDNLRCTALVGWNRPKQVFDLPNFSRYVPFARAISDNKPTFSPERENTELDLLWSENQHLSDVESFGVFPIVDGDRVSAVLSVAASCRIDFTPTFLSIIAGIARSLGVTLKNRLLYQEKLELETSAFDSTAALDSVELFTDVLHQVRNRMATIPEYLEIIRYRLKRREIPFDALELSTPYRDLSIELDKVTDLLQQASDAAQPPSQELESVLIRDVWANAVGLLKHRIERLGVSVPKPQGDDRIDATPVLLRQVFFHLILNSLNAFAARRSISDPHIQLYVQRNSSDKTVRIRYVDNAGGIDRSQLRFRGGRELPDALRAPEVAIFTRGVSSRADGTGHGLWIARKIIERHEGGIELARYRDGGVVFEILLPTDLRARRAPKKAM